ncbi:uncharacterized protein VTP21DRAFT_10459 [Calcarisporiella thermophila]|uniref:uncharacterized protein n=1 Tax=Calcarisporiella thermophila TaxID=911321 RepID=UPI0037438D7B
MPLVIITGIPCSGKTTRAKQLLGYFTQRIAQDESIKSKQMTVHLLNDDILGYNRDVYKLPVEEKKARGALMSAVERHLSKEDIVIADGMNYIKGFRYQLYCIARAIGTPHCVLHCGTSTQDAKEWNKERENAYEEKVFEELVSRYEEPDGRNRWDSPLFTVLKDDETIPGDDIWGAVVLRKPPPPNMSTTVKPISETNYLYELDQTTQEIIDAVLEGQKTLGIGGGPITVPKTDKKVNNPARNLTLSEVRRLRRQFTHINKIHNLLSMERIAEMFVDYLNTNLQ